jgi:hypothetical protein
MSEHNGPTWWSCSIYTLRRYCRIQQWQPFVLVWTDRRPIDRWRMGGLCIVSVKVNKRRKRRRSCSGRRREGILKDSVALVKWNYHASKVEKRKQIAGCGGGDSQKDALIRSEYEFSVNPQETSPSGCSTSRFRFHHIPVTIIRPSELQQFSHRSITREKNVSS